MKKLLAILLLGVSLTSYNQGIINNGAYIVNSGHINIQGGYTNQNFGKITNDGVISLTGNWINLTSDIFNSININSEVIFAGTNLQSIWSPTTPTFYFGKLTINNGSKVDISYGNSVTVYGTTTLNGPECLILRTSSQLNPMLSSFIDNGTILGNGTINMEYYSAGLGIIRRTWYFSSPVNNGSTTTFDVTKPNYTLNYWDENVRAWTRIYTNTTFTNMRGYSFKTDSHKYFNFIGKPNTGSFAINNIPRLPDGGQFRGFYLLGNPYPSYLNWDKLNKTNMLNIMWYRNENTSGVMVFDTWNGLVGTNNNGYGVVNGNIPPMTSFWARVDSDNHIGYVSVDNSMRNHNNTPNIFLKSSTVDLNTFKITVLGNGNIDENIILQTHAGEDNYDSLDAEKMFMATANLAQIFTLDTITKKKFVINTVKPITNNKDFILGVRIGQAGEYILRTDLSKINNNLEVTLEDKLIDTSVVLNGIDDYIFNTDTVTDGNRFVLHFKTIIDTVKPVIPIDTIKKPNSIVDNISNVKIGYSEMLGVTISNNIPTSQIFIYDIMGGLIYLGMLESDIDNVYIKPVSGCYIVKIIDRYKTTTKKLYIQN